MLARSLVIPVSLAALLFSVSCRRDPHITTFTVAPQNACAPDNVLASWTTTSDRTRLTTSSGLGGLDSPTPNAEVGVDVFEDTVFTLSAHIEDRSDIATRRVTVNSPLAFSEVIQGECVGSSPSFRTLVYEAAQYSERFKVTSIINQSTQPITVEHLTINRPLAVGEEVTAREFGAVNFVGTYRVTTALPPDPCQQQSTGGGPPPPALPRLQVRLVAACR